MEVGGVAVVTANYNTKDHIARLLYSLRTRVADDVACVVVVDNASTDSSVEFLTHALRAGQCHVIFNDTNRYHGPALNQAVDFVRTNRPDCRYVWLLDSDCVVINPTVVAEVRLLAERAEAGLIGEVLWDRWHNEDRLALYSLFIDLRALASIPDPWFEEDGDPSYKFEHACRGAGITTTVFPFAAGLSVIHVGRSSLRGVADRGETDNTYFEWATQHREPHFEEVDGAAELYEAFCAEFAAAHSTSGH